jgi:hypothetical protein
MHICAASQSWVARQIDRRDLLKHMATLRSIAPKLSAELEAALVEKGHPEAAEQLRGAAVERCTGSEDDDLGYVYFVRPAPSLHLAKLSAPVAQTMSLYSSHGLNIDIDHDGCLFGIEFIGRPDITDMLRAASVL